VDFHASTTQAKSISAQALRKQNHPPFAKLRKILQTTNSINDLFSTLLHFLTIS